MKIPIAKPYLTEDEAQAAHDVILSGWVTQGPQVEEFEKKFAKYTGAEYAVAVSSCTTALHLSLVVAGIKEGDEVICPSMTFIATANSVKYVGATPIFAEVGRDYNLDIEDVKSKITEKTKAVLLVHQIGMPADIDPFKRLCDEKGIKLIEDAACAIGSSYNSMKIGAHSDLVCFSFHPRKVLTTGDGGMITTSNSDYYQRLKLLRQHGMSINDRERHKSNKVVIEEYLEVGYNYRMTDIQAAVGVKQMEKLEWIVEERRKLALRYHGQLKELECLDLPLEEENKKSNYQSYSVTLNEKSRVSRNDLMQNLLEKGVATRRGIMMSHLEAPYKQTSPELPNTVAISENSMLIPLYIPMSLEEQDYVIQCLKEELR